MMHEKNMVLAILGPMSKVVKKIVTNKLMLVKIYGKSL